MAGKGFKEFVARHYRYIIVGGLFLVLVVILVLFLVKNKGKEEKVDSTESTIPDLESTVEVPKDKYEENQFPAVNSLVASYLDAMSKGDTETMASLSSSLSDDAKAFYEAQAKYIGNYSNYNVYTKMGPKENSYFLLTTYDIVINGQNVPLPALLSLYVCTNDTGALYINSESLTSDEEAYILELVAQKDFADLIEQVELDYNAALEANPTVAAAADSLKESINTDAQAILAERQQEEMQAAADAEAAAQQEAMEAASTQVKCTSDNVNIRSQASTDADSIGKSKIGDVYTRYEAMDNGWSKIDYNGQEAYIKSEFLEEVTSDEGGDGSEATAESSEGGDTEAAATETGGKVTVTENVNVRKSPDESGDKIATAYRGEQFELIEKKNGWCKITYKGQEAYVKADYVE